MCGVRGAGGGQRASVRWCVRVHGGVCAVVASRMRCAMSAVCVSLPGRRVRTALTLNWAGRVRPSPIVARFVVVVCCLGECDQRPGTYGLVCIPAAERQTSPPGHVWDGEYCCLFTEPQLCTS